MLGLRCCATGGVMVLRHLQTGTTMVLLPLFLARKFRLLAEAPRESHGE